MLNITQAYQVALISSSHTSEEDARRFMIASNELDWVSQIDGGCIVHAGLQASLGFQRFRCFFAVWVMACRGYRAYECFRIACES
ncbi:hypothetical protein ACJ6VV_24180, partial [Escherichia coli]